MQSVARGLIGVGPYAGSLPLSCHFQGGRGGGGMSEAGGTEDPNTFGLQ